MLIGAAQVRGATANFGVNPSTGAFVLETVLRHAARVAMWTRPAHFAWAAFDTYREPLRIPAQDFLENHRQPHSRPGRRVWWSGPWPNAACRAAGSRANAPGPSASSAYSPLSCATAGWFGSPPRPRTAERKPLPRPDLRQRQHCRRSGGVFRRQQLSPRLFGLAGGDTAVCLAAGCPWSSRRIRPTPAPSELIGQAVQSAVAECNLPEGVFSMLFVPAPSSAPHWFPTRVSRPSASNTAHAAAARR